jgi:MSHA biogenesis protein MshE
VAWLSRYLTTEQIRATKFAEGAGCTYCNMTGYKGRIGVYELIEVDAPMADAIRRGDLTELDRLASQSKGFVPLVQRALQHARQGTTSVEEVMKSMSGLEEYERASLLDDVLTASASAADAPAGAGRLTG